VSAERPKIRAPAYQGWEHLDVQGTLEEVVDALYAKALAAPEELDVRRMMPTKDLREGETGR
jgi:hypothetical protein